MFGAESGMFFDRTVLLTGAASGLGPDLAAGLVARGSKVIAVDHRAVAVRGLAERLGGVTALPRDLADPLAPVEIARWIADDHRDLTALICNATSTGSGPADCPADERQRQIFAPLMLAGLVWPYLQTRGRLVLALSPASGALASGFEALAARMRAYAWDTGGAYAITTATVAPERLLDAPEKRRRLAEAILGAAEAGKTTLRHGPRWPGRVRGFLPRADGAANNPA